MKIKSIELKNFRQFGEQRIDFSGSEDKKVTIIHGKTHIGKTTLVKAFLWCLYKDDDSFKTDPILVNKDIEDGYVPANKTIVVSVAIDLEHNGFGYSIKTEQTFQYYKNENGDGAFSPIMKDPNRYMMKMTPDGDPEPVPPENVDKEIEDILPRNLKNYFFYDGENNKIDDVAEKSSLQDAVRNIMNLNIREELIRYFAPNSSGRVYDRFESLKQSTDQEQSDSYQSEIDRLTKENENQVSNNDGLKKDIETLRSEAKTLEEQIEANADAEKLQKQYLDEVRELDETKVFRDGCFEKLIESFDSAGGTRSGLAGLFQSLAYKDSNLLTEFADIKTNSRAYEHQSEDSVDEIIKKGECICGAKVIEGNEFYKHLIAAKDYLFPRDFSASLNAFNKVLVEEKDASDASASNIERFAIDLKKSVKRIDELSDSIAGISKTLQGFHGDVGAWKKEAHEKRETADTEAARVSYSESTIIPGNESKISDLKSKKEKLSAASEKNNKLDQYLAYVNAVEDIATKRLESKKTGIAQALEKQVNDLFHAIVGSSKTELRLNPKNYNVEPYQSGKKITLSTGQKTMKNLAFVGGLIYLAKNKDKIGGDNDELDAPDDYPLVMDAPFSNLSKDDIHRACTELPKYCSQLIITLLDKDFDLSIGTLKPYINKSYSLTTDDTSTNSAFEEDRL